MSLRLQVKLFGAFAEAAGQDEIDFDIQGEATPASLWSALCAEHPALSAVSSTRLNAVNEEYASDDQPLSGDDVVAFFPPVSGG